MGYGKSSAKETVNMQQNRLSHNNEVLTECKAKTPMFPVNNERCSVFFLLFAVSFYSNLKENS